MTSRSEAAYRRFNEDEAEDDTLDKLDGPKNYRRFLPVSKDDEDEFFVEAMMHYGFGEPIRCLTTKFFGKRANIPSNDTKCPLCRRYNKGRAAVNKKYGRNTEKSKAEWYKVKEAWAPQAKYFSITYDPTKEELDLKILVYGSMILSALVVEYVEAKIHFFSIRKGRTMTIIRKKLSDDKKDVKYTVIRGDKREDITEIWRQILEADALPDIGAVIGEQKTPAEIEEIIKDFEISMEDDDEEEEADDADDEEEEAPKPKSKIKAKPGKQVAAADVLGTKPTCFGDPDVHDPADEVCQQCQWVKRCAKSSKVAEAYAEGRYERDEAEEDPGIRKVKKKLAARAGSDG